MPDVPYRLTTLVACVLASGTCAREPPAPEGPRASAAPSEAARAISLHIERASAVRHPTYLLVRCMATLKNGTGAALSVSTSFSSAFDAIAVVVVDEGGHEIARQLYNHHQSPFAEVRAVPLPIGSTTQQIGFPIDNPGVRANRVRVRLEGGLPGTAFPAGLVSNEVVVEIEERAAR